MSTATLESLTRLAVRADDPDTSYEAAMKAALGASEVRPVVLELVREHGPLTHDELINWYRRLLAFEEGTPRASDSGIRTRLRELVKAGLIVEDAEEGHPSSVIARSAGSPSTPMPCRVTPTTTTRPKRQPTTKMPRAPSPHPPDPTMSDHQAR
ncbi:hypothetical protein AHiyo8_01550 [Arthrobacter sp. Hiyo8]|nr:hypothetical protein AHiyo8_01550 [Arthrobacter sp. Hiyo8]